MKSIRPRKYDDHKHGDFIYPLSDEALALYDQFDEQICHKLNNQWQNGQFLHVTTAARREERSVA